MKKNKTIIYIECNGEPFVYEFVDIDYLPRVAETIFIHGNKYYIEEIWHEFTTNEHNIFIAVSEME